jgi:hypothetical protein
VIVYESIRTQVMIQDPAQRWSMHHTRNEFGPAYDIVREGDTVRVTARSVGGMCVEIPWSVVREALRPAPVAPIPEEVTTVAKRKGAK